MRLNACTLTYIHHCFNGADSKGINRLRFSDWLLILLHYNILPESVLLGHLSSKTHPKSHHITEAVKRGHSDSEIKTKSTKALSRREEGKKLNQIDTKPGSLGSRETGTRIGPYRHGAVGLSGFLLTFYCSLA